MCFRRRVQLIFAVLALFYTHCLSADSFSSSAYYIQRNGAVRTHHGEVGFVISVLKPNWQLGVVDPVPYMNPFYFDDTGQLERMLAETTRQHLEAEVYPVYEELAKRFDSVDAEFLKELRAEDKLLSIERSLYFAFYDSEIKPLGVFRIFDGTTTSLSKNSKMPLERKYDFFQPEERETRGHIEIGRMFLGREQSLVDLPLMGKILAQHLLYIGQEKAMLWANTDGIRARYYERMGFTQVFVVPHEQRTQREYVMSMKAEDFIERYLGARETLLFVSDKTRKRLQAVNACRNLFLR